MRNAEGWKIALQKDNQDHGIGDQSPVDRRIVAIHGPLKFPMVGFFGGFDQKRDPDHKNEGRLVCISESWAMTNLHSCVHDLARESQGVHTRLRCESKSIYEVVTIYRIYLLITVLYLRQTSPIDIGMMTLVSRIRRL